MSGTTTQGADPFFEDFDHRDVYVRVQGWLQSPGAKNFVVEFGQKEAKIARDLKSENFERLVKQGEPPKSPERPVRWINIWSPHTQPDLIDVLADKYLLSERFRAILKSSPPPPKPTVKEPTSPAKGLAITANGASKNDIELANGTIEKRSATSAEGLEDVNHYDFAERLINYQSLDLGEEYISIGANWMYKMKGPEQRLWSWLVLCEDSTVISVYEGIKPTEPLADYMKGIRGHTVNVLSQLSQIGAESAGSMFLVSVRKILQNRASHQDDGSEGSSNLFYYVFDNWYSGYDIIKTNPERLKTLSKEILGVIDEKHHKEPNKEIIPKLYKIGKQLRRYQHLYKSYKNIIDRILKYKAGTATQVGKRVALTLTASERFERLGDRIELLVLNSIDEAIAEKDALLNTHFQITAQKDSAATAKLSRNATLLSKLGVLFLPVSLMTSYFSTQIPDLQDIYSAKTYWVAFTIVMTISFVALFFLSRALVTVTESLDARFKLALKWCSARFSRKKGRVNESMNE